MELYQQTFIQLALERGALRFGKFTLKSGRVSPYFFNIGEFNTGDALAKLGEFYAQSINTTPIEFDMVFGPAYKGILLGCSVAIALSNLYNKNVPFCFNRKEAKLYGEKGDLIGAPLQGKILIIDDVITAGTASTQAAEIISQAGATIAGCIIAVDRQERGVKNESAVREFEKKYHAPIISIVTLDDIITYLKSQKDMHNHITNIKEYLTHYGINH